MGVLLLGLVIVIGSLVAAVWRIHWLRGTLRTKAEVLRMTSHEEEGSGQYKMMATVYVSQLEFAGPDGATVHFEQQQANKPRFRVGDRVSIRFHRSDPSGTAEVPFITEELMIWFAVVMVAALGSGFLYAGNELLHGRGTPSGTAPE